MTDKSDPRPGPTSSSSTAADARGSSLSRLAERHDSYDMRRVIKGLPNQLNVALDAEIPAMPSRLFNRVVLVGLGGSALPADVFNDAFASDLAAPIEVWRDYGLPRLNDRTLVIACSFSGSTEEVLSVLNELPATFRNVVALTSGGELAKLARARDYPLVQMSLEHEPPGFQPRSAFGYVVAFLARILHSTGQMSDPSGSLRSVARFLEDNDLEPAALKAATWLGDRIPIIYTEQRHSLSVGRVAKIKFNENAKRPAFFKRVSPN